MEIAGFLEGLPPKLQRMYRYHKQQMERDEEEEPFQKIGLYFSRFKTTIPEGSFYEEAIQNINDYWRLERLKSVGPATYVTPGRTVYQMPFNQTRYAHSLLVALLSERILRSNRFPMQDIETGIVAGLLHDYATPALGDAIKFIDPKNLHEEDHWQEMLDSRSIDFLEGRGLSLDKLFSAIKNRGILGQVLDVADRVTYVTMDLVKVNSGTKKRWWLHPNQQGLDDDEIEGPLRVNPNVHDLDILACSKPQIGDLFSGMKIFRTKDGEQDFYFKDPRILRKFLKVRALLHQRSYLHPITQARDAILASFVRPFYSPKGDRPLTPQKLREMGDYDLEKFLDNQYGFGPRLRFGIDTTTLHMWLPEFLRFDSMEDANMAATQLSRINEVQVLLVKRIHSFNTGTHYKVRNERGEIVPFKEFSPRQSEELANIARETSGCYVVYHDRRNPNSHQHSRVTELIEAYPQLVWQPTENVS